MIESLRRHARLLLVALWLGAAALFAGVVAPGAFAVLPTTELAGRIVSYSLTRLNIAGAVLSFALLAWSLFRAGGVAAAVEEDKVRGARSGGRAAWRVSLGVWCAAMCLTEFVINPRIARLRLAHDISSLAAGDSVRAEFGMLHGLSTLVFAAGAVAAFAALLISLRNDFAQRNVR